MCKSCLTTVEKYSKNDITFCANQDINKYNFDDFDVIHSHNALHEGFYKTKAKIIYNIHNFVISCPMGGNICLILNKFLKDPLTCSSCLGYFGIKTGGDNLKRHIKLAKRADLLAVHSEYMREYYHNYDPAMLPLPLETDVLTPCLEKEDYIFYTGRLSLEKNPYGFIDVVERTDMKAKMVLYTLDMDIANTEKQYGDLIKRINSNKNIELFLNPSFKDMLNLLKHAKFTVLPYFFAEPYGIAAANSVMCGTPLITFPYGNARNMTHLLPKTLDEMVKLTKMDNKQYLYTLEETLKKSKELRQIHNPKNTIKIWDNNYEQLFNKKN
jgi:glycosyltransferase involved in cell wall biosynthesis